MLLPSTLATLYLQAIGVERSEEMKRSVFNGQIGQTCNDLGEQQGG